MRFGPEICRNVDVSQRKEWLETNGLGGFASSTVAGIHTRRYHGLLVAATEPPAGRAVLLSKLEETLVIGGQRFELSANRYPGAIHPQGFQYLREFRLDPFPVFVYEAGGCLLEKAVFMVHGENTTVIEYRLLGLKDAEPCSLEIRPLIAFRDYHQTTHANDSINTAIAVRDGVASIHPYTGLPLLHFAHGAAEIEPAGNWYFNFEYDAERERGLDFREDLFNPFVLRADLGARSSFALIASTEMHLAAMAPELRRSEIVRRERIAAAVPGEDPLVRALARAADQFIVGRGEGTGIIAGYPWFGEWGRDTMIALPGLTLTTGRTEIAAGILLAYSKHADRGMLPNRFSERGETPEYNTADATLWFFEAIRALLHKTGDLHFVRHNFYPLLRDIIEWHVRGTRYGIHVDHDGLLQTGQPGVQLTWMDAKVGDWVITPRCGKPVEIQALWYNALRILQDLSERFGDYGCARQYASMASKAAQSFNAQFWNEEAGCLYDLVYGGFHDPSIRPNQILAVSLPYPILEAGKSCAVVDTVEHELLTPAGLRTLARGDAQYHERYEGDPASRDFSYHQGAVWPWLLGPFLSAYLRVRGRTPRARSQAAQWLRAFEAHLEDAGLGQVSELFDGEPPHQPRGCIAQAWSVGELLRVAVEEVFEPDVIVPDRSMAASSH